MPEQRDALTELVRAHVGEGKRWSTREFAARAVDAETGWSPAKSVVHKIAQGGGYQVTPRLISAIAAGLELPREVVGAAAHLQIIGYTEKELSTGAPAKLIRTLGALEGDTPKAQAVADRWEREASGEA